jgi:hypothetical protein
MIRRPVLALIAILLAASVLVAADKTVSVTLIKVDIKKKILFVKSGDDKKEYVIDAKTKFLGPKGGASEAGIKDDRLKPGAPLELVIAGNNRTVREVRLPERKDLK